MPRKIRELTKELTAAGFVLLAKRGKGDHRFFRHPAARDSAVIIDGQPGDDARDYQERDVREAIEKVRSRGL